MTVWWIGEPGALQPKTNALRAGLQANGLAIDLLSHKKFLSNSHKLSNWHHQADMVIYCSVSSCLPYMRLQLARFLADPIAEKRLAHHRWQQPFLWLYVDECAPDDVEQTWFRDWPSGYLSVDTPEVVCQSLLLKQFDRYFGSLDGHLQVGTWDLDIWRDVLMCGGLGEKRLSRKHWRLLVNLAKKPGLVHTHETLEMILDTQVIDEEPSYGGSNRMAVHIHKLRRLLVPVAKIETVQKIGYRLKEKIPVYQ